MVATCASSTSKRYWQYNSPILIVAVVCATVCTVLPSASLTVIASLFYKSKLYLVAFSRLMKLFVAPLSIRQIALFVSKQTTISINFLIALIVVFEALEI